MPARSPRRTTGTRARGRRRASSARSPCASRRRRASPCAGTAARPRRAPARRGSGPSGRPVSVRSSTVKPGDRPSAPPWSRSRRLAVAWNVPPQTRPSPRSPVSVSARLEHLARGAAREREQQDPLGRHAAVDQAGDPAGQRPRLAGAGAGHDQQRPAEVLDGLALLGVEALERVEHAFEQHRGGSDRARTSDGPALTRRRRYHRPHVPKHQATARGRRAGDRDGDPRGGAAVRPQGERVPGAVQAERGGVRRRPSTRSPRPPGGCSRPSPGAAGRRRRASAFRSMGAMPYPLEPVAGADARDGRGRARRT